MKKELLFSITRKDFEITWFGGSGAGGQHRNKHHNCCRIVHKASGIMSTGQGSRSREQNKRQAFTGLVNKGEFKAWLKIKISECSMDRDDIESAVNDIIDNEKDMIMEHKENGLWVRDI